MEKKIKKRVLLICPFFSPNLGGVETHLDDFTRYLQDKGFYTYVLTYQPLTTAVRAARFEKKRNLEIRRVPWFGHDLFHKLEPYPLLELAYLFPPLFLASFWFMITHHQKIDVIHCHGFVAAIITRLLAIFFPKKTVMNLHAIYNFKQRKLMARLAQKILFCFDTVFALAQPSKADLLQTGLADQKIKTYTQWVNQKLFKPRPKNPTRKKLGLKKGFYVLLVGRLLEKKGPRLLAEIALELPGINFLFLGDGPLKQALKKLSRQNKNIFVLGKKTQAQTALFYSASDVVAVPSLYEEGFARVVLEALSSGRPVIASKKGCLPFMINDQTGILLPPQKKKFKKAILELYQNQARLQKLSKNCRQFALKNYGLGNAQKIINAYL